MKSASGIVTSKQEQSNSLEVNNSLYLNGWMHYKLEIATPENISSEIERIGNSLGRRTAGRAGVLEEIVQPLHQKDAHPRSLSAQYGLNTLPFHVELSHRELPCRYVLLGCIATGKSCSSTKLIDWRNLGFSSSELSFLEQVPILVRNGRRSFYSTILNSERTFLRYDPGCIEAIDKRGEIAIQLVEKRLGSGIVFEHKWCQGDILIIDNWRILHGRGASKSGSERRLLRALIDA